MSDYEIIERTDVGEENWNLLVNNSDEAWLWSRYEFQDTLTTWPGRIDASFAVSEKSNPGSILATVPLHSIRRRFANLVDVPRLESFGGLGYLNKLGEKARKRVSRAAREYILTQAEKQSAIKVDFVLPVLAPAWRGTRCPRVNPLLELGCENTLTQTWLVDLRSGIDGLWKKMEGRARTAIRKAEKSGVTVRLADQNSDLDTYYSLHTETYHRTGVPPHPKGYFEKIWEIFAKGGYAKIWFAELDGRVIAAENCGIYKGAAMYWTGASSVEGLSSEANSLLQWHAMRWMVENSVEWYETGEAHPNAVEGKSKGLNEFKKSFGGELYPYYKGRIESNTTRSKLYRVAKLFFP